MIPLLRTLVGLTFGWFITRFVGVLARLHLHSSHGSLVSRRGFLRNATLGSVTIVLTMLTGGTVRLLWPNKVTGFGSVITVPATNVPEVGGEPFRFTQGQFFIVHNEDGLLALWWKCPHLGCTVPWAPSENQFHCPCHGSIYDRNGVRTAGPAPRPMDLMTITVEGGDLKVDTGSISTRSDYSPDQAVPYTA